MAQSTARLRKAFHYPADSDSEDSSFPEALDEQEQEFLIHRLKEQNNNVNVFYTRVLSVLPVCSIIPYIPTLFSLPTTTLSILSISSLACTTYLLLSLPPGRTNVPFLDAWNKIHAGHPQTSVMWALDDGPITRYLPSLNLLLSAVLAALSMVFRGREQIWVGFGWLPAMIYCAVLLAKVFMGSVDPETELGGLKYEFKGA